VQVINGLISKSFATKVTKTLLLLQVNKLHVPCIKVGKAQ